MPITLDSFRRLLHRARGVAVSDAGVATSGIVTPAAVPQPAGRGPTARSSKTAGRPISASMSKAIELVRNNPNLTANQLADAAAVSKDYARILLKRAKARVPALAHSRPTGAVLHAVDGSRLSADRQPWRDSVEELRLSLDRTQAQVAELVAAPRLRTSLHFNRRASVVRLHQTGRAVSEIATELSINPGEVEFILKVNRLIEERF